jgi:hypothetical protein
MEPCSKEEVIDSIKNSLSEMRVKQVEIAGDVSHVKSRIDNGMSHTIENIHRNLTDIVPIVQRFVTFETRINDLIWWGAKILTGVILCLIAWAIAKGFTPHISIGG